MIDLKKVQYNYHKASRTLFMYLDEPTVYDESLFQLKNGHIFIDIKGRTVRCYDFERSKGRRDYFDHFGNVLIIKKNYPKEQDILKKY